MARDTTPAPAGKRKAVRRVAKPKTAYVVVEGITAEEFKNMNPRVVLSDSEMLDLLNDAIDNGKKIARYKVVIPVKQRKPAGEGGAPAA